MSQSLQERKARILLTRPELSAYLSDIPSDIAARAFHNVSFSPEQRGLEIQVEYASRITEQKTRITLEIENAIARNAVIQADWPEQLEEWFETYRQRMKVLFMSYLATMSTCASPMITGPARFPVERQRKRNASADNKYAAVTAYTTHSPNRFLKRVMPFGNGVAIASNAPNANELLISKLNDRIKLQETMKAANKIVGKVYKKGSPAGVSAEMRDRCAQQLVDELAIPLDEALSMLKSSDYSTKIIAFWPYQLSNNNQEIRRLEQRVKDVERLQQAAPEIAQVLGNGIEIRKSDDGKIEIHFGYKPDAEVRDFLCKKAFKFSRYRNNAWVRRISVNAVAVFTREVKPMLENLPQK